jgi:hypothetical protein
MGKQLSWSSTRGKGKKMVRCHEPLSGCLTCEERLYLGRWIYCISGDEREGEEGRRDLGRQLAEIG